MIEEAIIALSKNEDLTTETVEKVMDEIMSGETTNVQTAAYLSMLSVKGETEDEIVASAKGMRKHATQLRSGKELLEIVGTGGDRSNSFNISTTSSIVIAAAGVPVAKHGNRAASSRSGAADVLEALGVNIKIDPKRNEEVLDKVGMCFLFAQTYHSAMKYVGPVRKELAIRTVFNILGPLTNPANATMQVMGVYSDELVEPMSKILYKLGVTKNMVVFGEDGLDEISASAKTKVCEVIDGKFSTYELDPRDYGFELCDKSELVGGTPQENAQITRDILTGKERGGKRTAVVLNSAAALHIAKGISFEDAIKLAEEVIDSGKANAKLDEFIAATSADNAC